MNIPAFQRKRPGCLVVSDHANDRAVVEWVIAEGGYVQCRVNGETVTYSAAQPPPPGPLSVLGVGFNLSAGKRIAPAEFRRFRSPPLEAQVVDVVDSIAYDTHDTDDALGLGFIMALWLMTAGRTLRNGLLAAILGTAALPPFLTVNSWIDLFGRTGSLHLWLPFELYSFSGCIVLLTAMFWPVAALLIHAALRQTNPELWEADPALHIVICTAHSDRPWDEIERALAARDRWLVLKNPSTGSRCFSSRTCSKTSPRCNTSNGMQ